MGLSRFLFVVLLLLFYSAKLLYSQSFTVSGFVKDSLTGEPLIGATLKLLSTNSGTSTNESGYYKFNARPGKLEIEISFIGYKSKTVTRTLDQNIVIPFFLIENTIQTREVVISNDEDKNVRSTEMSRAELSAEKIKSLPVILGEPDVLKAITLLPGIKSGGEGNTGFYVRGGGPDQNLIMMDDAVVYNPSHLLGFLSVFNSDAVRNAEIIKGGIPANYGGRLSSILNVNMRDGDAKDFEVSGGVGLISSRLTLEGPVQKEKSSFIFSARRTYIDALIKPLLEAEQKGNGYYFYDTNFKINYILSPKNKLFVSAYVGRDKFTFKSPRNNNILFNVSWGNTLASLRWNHTFNPKFFVNTVLVYNRYDLRSAFQFINNEFVTQSGLRDWNLKSEFEYHPNRKHKIKSGYNYTWHTFIPGIASGNIGRSDLSQEIYRQYAHEAAFFILDDFAISDRLFFNTGLRYVLFNQVGPYAVNTLNENGEATGEYQSWEPQESIKFYHGLEPRFAATYLLNDKSSIKASYTKTHQFLHLATSSGASFPSDLWIPSSRKVKPQIAEQVAIGYFRNFRNNKYEASVESYYKTMLNQIEFRPGARLFLNQNLEEEIISGIGRAYGMEFFLKKKYGRLNGWIGYTLSKTTRQFDELNNGKTFLYRYDRRHDFSLVLSYKITEQWEANFVFVYATGIAVTLPLSRYSYNVGIDNKTLEPKFTLLNRYDEINNYRLPAYHRADVSFIYNSIKNKDRKIKSSWVFSVYNIYNRKNPYFIYVEPDIEEKKVKAFMVYLFPIVPSVQWNFSF